MNSENDLRKRRPARSGRTQDRRSVTDVQRGHASFRKWRLLVRGGEETERHCGVFEHLVAPLERIAVVALGKSKEVSGDA